MAHNVKMIHFLYKSFFEVSTICSLPGLYFYDCQYTFIPRIVIRADQAELSYDVFEESSYYYDWAISSKT